MSDLRRETLTKYPSPPETPLEALAHVLAIYEDSPDEKVVLAATVNVYPEAPWTGLRLGDLRRLLDDHAHELAERVRDHPWAEGCAAGCCDDDRGARKAADLIDPEVSK